MTVSRRSFFSSFGRAMLDSIAAPCRESGRAAADRKAAQPPRGWLRPPGALPEPEFLAACTRCTDCIEACPYTAIRRLGPEFGDVAGTPAIIPLDSPCYLCPDMPCIPACKPLALRPTAKRDVTMGLAVLDRTACYVAQGQPCDYCVERCPLKHEAIAFGDDGVPVIDEQRCTGCGVCAYLCPPDAIAVHHRD